MPVSTKMPAPMMAPTPMAVMLNAPSTLGTDLKALPSIAMMSAIGLRAKMPLWSIPLSPRTIFAGLRPPCHRDCGGHAADACRVARHLSCNTWCSITFTRRPQTPAKEEDHDPHDPGDPRPDRRGRRGPRADAGPQHARRPRPAVHARRHQQPQHRPAQEPDEPVGG